MLDKEQIKQYLEAFVKNPYTMPDLSLFADAVKAVSAEELEPIIQMLEDENVPLSEYKATLKPLKDVMGPLARGSVIGHMQNSGVRKNVLDQLKVIHKYKMRQKAKKK
jgi:Glu-tRNA(Gln) amidotransferase subunit E-like FAD-binding protein